MTAADTMATDAGGRRRPSAELAALGRSLDGHGDIAIDDIVSHFGSDASVGWLLLLLAVPAVVPSPACRWA